MAEAWGDTTDVSVLVIADKSGRYGRQLLAGVGQYARQRARWTLGVVDVHHWSERTLPAAEGVIAQITDRSLREALKGHGTVVNVGDGIECPGLPQVHCDHREIGRLGAEHFLERGFQHLAYLGRAEGWYAHERRHGFVARAGQAGTVPVEYWLKDWATRPNQKAELENWLLGLRAPCGLMACDDSCAQLAAALLRKRGRGCPEQVAVLGVDNDELICELQPVPLSSVALAGERVGYEAAAMLEGLMKGEPAPSEAVVVAPVGVVARRSTDVRAVTDELVSRAMEYIRLHATDPANTQHLLNYLGVSRRQLEQRFAAVMQRTPAAEMRRQRVEKAKQLLANTEMAMGEMAVTCGFGDGARLAKVFRREVGMTPLEYRRRTRLISVREVSSVSRSGAEAGSHATS